MGWKQGSTFRGLSLRYLRNVPPDDQAAESAGIDSRPVSSKERLVLISQTCDVVADAKGEPNVEALICRFEKNQAFLDQIDRNSARWFVIDRDTGLVAQARYRVQIAKEVLRDIQPAPWPSSHDRFERFVRWLARRYDRPAVPDGLYEHFQRPVEDAFRRIFEEGPEVGRTFSHTVHEIRITVPENDAPPYQIQVFFLLAREELSLDEANALDGVKDSIQTAVDRQFVVLDGGVRLNDRFGNVDPRLLQHASAVPRALHLQW